MKDAILDDHIINIVHMNEISDQRVLQKLLAEREINIPQATLSRKLKKLNITKISGVYKVIEYSPQRLPVVLDMQVSDYGLIVMHTHPGQAGGLAYFIDRKYVSLSKDAPKIHGILGTIAGDDIVVVIVKSEKNIDSALEVLYENFPYLRP
jgi:transcriptional regulator of arginine metabolism